MNAKRRLCALYNHSRGRHMAVSTPRTIAACMRHARNCGESGTHCSVHAANMRTDDTNDTNAQTDSRSCFGDIWSRRRHNVRALLYRA